jgi:hypothetical protein
MTLEQFNKLKQQVTQDLQRKVNLSQKLEQPYAIALNKATATFTLNDNDSAEQQLQTLQEVTSFAKEVNGSISHTSHDDGKGRVGYYDHTTFSIKYLERITEVPESLVKSSVHKALRSIMGLSKYSYIKCEIMQLFKDGKIDWEAVVKAHKEDCSL